MNSVLFRLLFLLLPATWLPEHAATAQERLDASAPPPSAPLVRSLPDGAGWRLRAESPASFRRREAAEKEPGARRIGSIATPVRKPYQIVAIAGAFSGGICRSITEFGDGTRQWAYLVDGQLLLQHPKTGKIALLESADELSRAGLVARNGRFRELSWIALPFYRGVRLYNKRPCHVYSQYQRPFAWMGDETDDDDPRPGKERGVPLAQAGTAPGKRPKPLQTALIDAETRLPVLLETRDVVWSYEFGDQQTAFGLPPEYADVLKSDAGTAETIHRRYRIPQ